MSDALIDSTMQTEIIQNLMESLRNFYVFPDVAEQICERLQTHLETGDYADINEAEFFAYALTQHVQEVNQDEHLWVKWHPEPISDHEGSLLQNQDRVEEWKQKGKLDNYGLHKVERLPGNVGFLDIRYFYRTSWGSGETIVAAMNFLANVNAVIVDLRNCMGGNPSTVAMICSYFFEEEPVHLNSLYWRKDDLTEQYWSLPYVPGKRLVDQPVYILTSNKTFSGGEEFAYNLQTRRRATLVGERTGGGAHPGSPYRLHQHFEAFIPNGRAINPITHQNWEGSGVQPDIPVSQDQALKVAYQLALESILENIRQPVSRPFRLLLEEAQTALKEIEIS
jgi:C-terminal processing protease CtpA/Prc